MVEAATPAHCSNRVTSHALYRESLLHMVRISCRLEIRAVASNTLYRCSCVTVRVRTRVTFLALGQRMFTKKRKACLFVLLPHVRYDP